VVEEFKARNYQAAAISWVLSRPFSGLIMRPGLGKTACVLAARVVLKKKKLSKRCLVIAPYNVAAIVWAEEIAKWGFALKTGFAHGTKFEQVIQDKTLDVVTMTCDGVERLARTFTPNDILKLFDHLVCDESTKFKHTGAKRFKLLKPYLSSFARRTVLTGTPAPNGYQDLFGQAFVTDRGHRLGKFITRYTLEYFNKTGFGGYTTILKKGAAKKIQAKLGDVWMFVNDEALGLARYQLNQIRIELPERAAAHYTSLRRDMLLDVGGKAITAVNAAVLSNKLRQVASGAAYGDEKRVVDLHDAKLTALVDLIEQLQGDPVIVGYEFDHERAKIVKELGPKTLVIQGATTKRQRREILAKFNTGEHPVLLAQSATIAHGLNLQKACHTVCFYTVPWDLEVFEQFLKRVHRLGQLKRVMVHAIVARGTIDEGVLKVLRMKDHTQRQLVAALAAHIEETDDDDVSRCGKVPREIRRTGRVVGGRRAVAAGAKPRGTRLPRKVHARGTRRIQKSVA